MKLIQENGQPIFGVLPQPLSELNYRDYDLRTAMDKKRGKLAQHFSFNQFQFIGINNNQWILGVAIVDLKWVANAFVYCFDKRSGDYQEFSFLSPFAWGTAIADTPNHGCSSFKQGNKRIAITCREQQRHLSIKIADKLTADISIDESCYARSTMMPLSLCSRAGYQGWGFTQKSNALPATGQITWRNKTLALDHNTLANVDWSGGYMRRETFWNWASLSCYLDDGRRLGFNLAAGVNETGTSENILWLDDKPFKIDMVNFQFDRYDHQQAWVMQSQDGMIDVRFNSAGQRSEKINTGLIASNFVQHFGRFQGRIQLPEEDITLDGQWGFCEDHYAKW